jgi:hypothetical protein
MSDAEKREMAAVDARARALLERTEALTPEQWQAMHGTLRQVEPPRAGMRVGARVRLHLAVDLVALAFDRKLGVFARVAARLADDALQARQMALEWDHASLHESALQIRGDARLLRQQRIGFIRQPVQQLVDARDVVRGFCERARQLLNRGIAIELERVEAAFDVRIVLVAVQNLRLGLRLELAKLLAQTQHRAAELAQMEFDRMQLLAQP